jgi:hypothetical protein
MEGLKTAEQILDEHRASLPDYELRKAVLNAMDAYLQQHIDFASRTIDESDNFNMDEFVKMCKERPGEEKKLAAEGFMKISGDAFLRMWFMLGCENEMCGIFEHESGRYFLSFVPEKNIPFYLRKSVIDWDVLSKEWFAQDWVDEFNDVNIFNWFKERIIKMVLLPPGKGKQPDEEKQP